MLGLNMLKFLKILKIARITRLTKVINKLEMDEQDKGYIKILKVIFDLFLIMHLLGCTWYAVIGIEEVWAPPPDFVWVSRTSYGRFYDSDQCNVVY